MAGSLPYQLGEPSLAEIFRLVRNGPAFVCQAGEVSGLPIPITATPRLTCPVSCQIGSAPVRSLLHAHTTNNKSNKTRQFMSYRDRSAYSPIILLWQKIFMTAPDLNDIGLSYDNNRIHGYSITIERPPVVVVSCNF